MKFKKSLFLLTVISVLAISSIAFAVNTAQINVTSEPIRQYATCDKAGGFTITFDKTTMLKDGDQITADLDIGATLCRNIDLVIARGAGAVPGNPRIADIGWDETTPNEGSPVTINNAQADVNDFTSDNGGIFFWVHGTAGSSRIIVDVIGANLDGNGVRGTVSAGSITVGDDDGDTLSLQFLDQKVNPDYDEDGVWVNGGNGVYNVGATLGQNTLCIDVSQLPSNVTKVNANCDSKQDKFTFIPSNPQVAHVVTAMNFQLAACKGSLPGAIVIGTKGVVQSGGYATCTSFDNESGVGYCAGTHGNNFIIIESLSGSFEMTEYQIKLELLKNDGAPTDINAGAPVVNDGIYWTNVPVQAIAYNTSPCEVVTNADGAAIMGTYSYLTAANVATTNNAAEAPNSADCDVDVANYAASTLITASSNLGITPTNKYLYVNMPPINYDLDMIAAGDSVSVRVTLLKTPCGELFKGKVNIGVFGCAQVKPTYALVYPYFTEDGGDWWNGLAITNLGKTDGTATIYFHEADGDVGTLTVQVPAGSIYAEVKDTILSQSTVTGSGLGNVRAYAVVCTDFNADGFALIGNSYTGVGQGYIPRLPSGLPVDCSK